MDKHKPEHNIPVWAILALVLSIPAFLINLGLHPYIEDEAIRVLVALEMDLSGSYFYPTLGGEAYYAKPPLYNWILLGFSFLTGGLNEWTTRIPTVLFLYGFVFYIYKAHRRLGFSSNNSLLIALLFMTCGRIVFWDSFLGLIDIFFSWVAYAMIVEMFINWQKERWWRLFGITYFLVSIGFLLKGFPILVFFIFTGLWIWLLDRRVGRQLITVPNIIGLLIPVLVVGGYYWIYQELGEVDSSLAGLADQAARRTVFRYDIESVIRHFFTYPFENLYHFLPWTLIGFLFFKKGGWKLVKQDSFIFYCAGAFVINIIPYWVSPEVFPRYILMLIPLAFSVLVYWYHRMEEKSKWRIGYDNLFNILGFGGLVFMGISFLNNKVTLVDNWQLKAFSCLVVGAVLVYFLFKTQKKIWVLINIVLVMRIAFNWFVIPIRMMEDDGLIAKNDAERIAEKYGSEDIHMYRSSIRDYTTIFHIENKINKIISVDTTSEIMIFNPLDYDQLPKSYGVVDSMYVRRIDGQAWVLKRKEPKTK
jgi:4-amino-4-deoxy-L-arabinose transferase-like glycosyltransferase